MSDQSGRPSRRPLASRDPLAQPFSHSDTAVDQPLGERLLPVERSPFSVPVERAAQHQVPPTRPAGAGRRQLGEGGLSYTAGAAPR